MSSATPTPDNPICVIGGGLVGLLATLSLSDTLKSQGQRLTLIAPKTANHDGRTTAMLMPSIELLKRLDVWDDIKAECAPLKTMRLIDGSKRLIRSPVIDFRSSEVDMDAFGYNVPNEKMLALLEDAINQADNVERIPQRAKSTVCNDTGVTITTEDNQIFNARLAVAADGRNSTVREAADILTKEWSYPQTALVLTFSHTIAHGGVSAEFHTETGPFTQVPLPPTAQEKNRSSLVWVASPKDADQLLGKDLKILSREVETKLQSSFGKVSVENAPQAFPLSGMTAKSFGAKGVVLIGESAHVFPPIGAQGFNLGVRDIEALVKLLNRGTQIEDVPAQYNRARTADIHLRTLGIDALNRSLLTDFLPVQLARAAGISTLGSSSFLRKLAMKSGMGSAIRFNSLVSRKSNASNT